MVTCKNVKLSASGQFYPLFLDNNVDRSEFRRMRTPRLPLDGDIVVREETRDGAPIAVIAPLPDDPLARLVAEGRARPPLHAFRVPDPACLPRGRSPHAASDSVSEGRDERR